MARLALVSFPHAATINVNGLIWNRLGCGELPGSDLSKTRTSIPLTGPFCPWKRQLEAQIEATERHAVEERWNEEARCALEAVIAATQDRIKETRTLIAKIDEILAKRR